VPFYIPALIWSAFIKQDVNSLTQNKSKLSGEINVKTSECLLLASIKRISKVRKTTINDVMMSAVTTALGNLFKKRKENVKEINMVIPVSIRFGFPKSRQAFEHINKITAYPMRLPLTDSMVEAYPKISKVTKLMRSRFAQIYSSYAMSSGLVSVLPRFMMSKAVHDMSEKFTICFSNTPGPIKEFFFKTPEGSIMKNISCSNYSIVAGNNGFILLCISTG